MTTPYTKRIRFDSTTVEATLQRDVPANGRGGVQADIGFAKLGKQEPCFNVLAAEFDPRERTFITCANHTIFGEKFPEVAHLAKWHLCEIRSGPMHYEANAIFWAEMAQGKRERNSYDPDPIAAFKRCVVFGAIDETDPGTGAEGAWFLDEPALRVWLAARKPALMAKFHEEIEAAFPGMWTLAEGL